MAQADVDGGRQRGQIAFIAQEAAGQRVVAALAGRGVGPEHHPGAGLAAEVLGRGPVHARAADDAAVVGGMPGQFTEYPGVGEARVLDPAVGAVRNHGVALARAMAALLEVQARHQAQVGRQVPGAGDAAAPGGAVHVGGHRHWHHAVRVRLAQGVVVHHVVGVVVVELRLQLVQHAAQVALLGAQPEALALELRAVHAAAGIARLAVAGARRQFIDRIGVGREAQRHVGIPFVPARRHGVAVAILVVLRMRVIGREAGVDLVVAHRQVGGLVVAAV